MPSRSLIVLLQIHAVGLIRLPYFAKAVPHLTREL